MSTQPTTIVTVPNVLSHYLTWFRAHEKLILVVALGIFGIYFYSRGIDFLVKHDQTQAQIATQQAQAAATKVTADDTSNKILQAQLAQITAQNQITNERVDQIMRQNALQTQVQKKQDDTMQAGDLAVRIQKLLGVGNIKVDPSNATTGSLIFSNDAAHADADKLEDLGQALSDVNGLNTKLVSCKILTDKQADTITGLSTQIMDGKTALTTEQTSHVKDVKLANDQKKKSWLSGFKTGVTTTLAVIFGLKVAKTI